MENVVKIVCPHCNGHKTCTRSNGGYCTDARGVAHGWIWATRWEER